MLAIGEMVLNGGRYQNQQVLSERLDRRDDSHADHHRRRAADPGYGYAWWTGQAAGQVYTLANGWGGQFIMVVPARRLVVTSAARTSGLAATAAMAQWQRIFDIVTERVVPAMLVIGRRTGRARAPSAVLSSRRIEPAFSGA